MTKQRIVDFLIKRYQETGNMVIQFTGISMRPTIIKGQKIKIYNYPIEDILIGDIIAYRVHPMHITVHRVKEVIDYQGRTKFVTKGDNNECVDSYFVSNINYLGKVRILGNEE